mgnify:CR=1 FL=1
MIWQPSSINISSSCVTCLINRLYWSLLQNPITGSTTARLYQLLSKKTISPGLGSTWMYLLKYHCPFSTSVGFVRATTRDDLGFKCSLNRFIAPPLPAASLPSKIIATRILLRATHFWRFTNSDCSSCNSASYCNFFKTLLTEMLFFLAIAKRSFLVFAPRSCYSLNPIILFCN